ncbi:hypothetical protein [Carnobacterium maltaromaticum]|uniref:hypothetical protein n=1 Tax=Carnobacterium maltaromaticum TaxID=2751 RepID=UPI0039BEC875
MITYLDTALMNSETLIGGKAKPSGAFYLHVKNPFISNDKISDEENYQEELEKYLRVHMEFYLKMKTMSSAIW